MTRIVESEKSELSRIFSRVRIIQLDQSEYVPGRALLKDRFNCCIKWSYAVTHNQLPATLKMTNH